MASSDIAEALSKVAMILGPVVVGAVAHALERGDVADEHRKTVADWLAEQSESAKALAERFPPPPPSTKPGVL